MKKAQTNQHMPTSELTTVNATVKFFQDAFGFAIADGETSDDNDIMIHWSVIKSGRGEYKKLYGGQRVRVEYYRKPNGKLCAHTCQPLRS